MWIDKSEKEHEREQSVVGEKNEFGEFNKFVAAVMPTVSSGTIAAGAEV